MPRYTDVDELLKYIPYEEIVSRFAVANAPIADVAPIKHSFWDEVKGECRCSNCKAILEEYMSKWVNFNYCYHCGAIMDGKENDT